MKTQTESLLGPYLEWFRANAQEREVGADWVELTVPLLDRHNDFLQVLARRQGDRILLTDDGETLRDLRCNGCDINTQARRRQAEKVLIPLGIDDEWPHGVPPRQAVFPSGGLG